MKKCLHSNRHAVLTVPQAIPSRHTGFHTQWFHWPLIRAPMFQDIGQPRCNLNRFHLWLGTPLHNVMKQGSVYHSIPQYTTVHQSIPQYITVYHSISQYTTVHHSTPQYITVYHSISQYTTVYLGIPQYISVYHSIS